MKSNIRSASSLSGTLVGSLLIGLVLVAGCLPFGDPPVDPLDAVDQTQQDIESYNQLASRLSPNRTEFLSKKYSYQQAQGNQLYYLDFPGFDPRLHRSDRTGRMDYTFSIGPGNGFNFRASDSVIVTAYKVGSDVEYRAYGADAANKPLGTTLIPAPSGSKWWAYAVSNSDVYIVTYDDAARKTILHRWTIAAPPQALFTLEEATGQPVLGELLDFGVDGDTMVFIEGGRIWRMSIAAKRATWLRNMTQVLGGNVDFQPDGVTFTSATGHHFFALSTMNLFSLNERIRNNPFRLSDTFKTSHLVDDGGFSRWGVYLIYIGSSGVFAYDMVKDTITPILLEVRGDTIRTEYRYPQVTSDGTLYVTGLESKSGSVGADGPIFQVELPRILK